MKNSLKEHVIHFQHEKAYQLIKEMPAKEKWELISTALYDTSPCSVYSFLMYMLAVDRNEGLWHYYCYEYLVYCNPFSDDPMSLAAWHLRCAISESSSLSLLKEVLSIFYSYPVQLFSDAEFLGYANTVLHFEPDNVDAKKIVSKLQTIR